MNRLFLASLVGAALFAAPAAFGAEVHPAHPAKLAYPVCDATHKDHCIELGKYAFIDKLAVRDYPQCARIESVDRRAACIESSYRGVKHPA
ncbi:MAG TPA: hypothetical protein VMF53_12630 [Alphaproteobacteria bacterium]|nr:hypothetical protein [Alphaproteobacteria bacterium]